MLEKALRTRQVGTGTKWGRGYREMQELSGSDRLNELVVTGQGVSTKVGAVSNKWVDDAGS